MKTEEFFKIIAEAESSYLGEGNYEMLDICGEARKKIIEAFGAESTKLRNFAPSQTIQIPAYTFFDEKTGLNKYDWEKIRDSFNRELDDLEVKEMNNETKEG